MIILGGAMKISKFVFSIFLTTIDWASSIARLPIASLGGVFTGFFF
jgi:hypothetical protein